MKLVVMVLTMACVASAAAPAFADEDGAGVTRHHGRATKKTETPTVKADDRAYKAALDRVPPPTQKYDPWGTMRPANDKH
jgi:hypothetical protein